MARPRQHPADRIARLSRQDGTHRIWTGTTNRGRPLLKGYGHPVRALLKLEGKHLRLRPACSNPLCINIEHWAVIRCVDAREGVAPEWIDPRTGFDEKDEDEIAFYVREYQSTGVLTTEDLPPNLLKEVKRRCNIL